MSDHLNLGSRDKSAVSGATTHVGLTHDEKLRLAKINHAEQSRSVGTSGEKAVAADEAATVLGSLMILRGWDAATTAARTGLHETRIARIAGGHSLPEGYERAALSKAFLGNDPDVLAAANTPENRAKLKPLI